MPNWCYCSYTIIGDEKELNDLYEKMKSLEDREESLVENDFGKTWLGNLVTLLGGNWKDVSCRGEWFDLGKGQDCLRFNVQSAWSEPYEVNAFLVEKFPSLGIYFLAEESGMGYYVTNDVTGAVYDVRYRLTKDSTEEEYDFMDGEEERLFATVSELIGKDVSSINECQEAIQQYNDNNDWEDWIEIKHYMIVE